jgi:hypothetical protein
VITAGQPVLELALFALGFHVPQNLRAGLGEFARRHRRSRESAHGLR